MKLFAGDFKLNNNLSGKAPANHTHAWSAITGKPTTYAPSAHAHDDMAVVSVGSSVSLVELNERCGNGKKKTFYYTSIPTLPSVLAGSVYLFVTLYKSARGLAVCDAIGIKNDGSVIHAFGYYAAYDMIWTVK